jgi:hypothetical protein
MIGEEEVRVSVERQPMNAEEDEGEVEEQG